MHNVLFVDDETDNLDALERVFRKKYNIFKANSGPAALDILKQHSITVIISDQRMPDMTGVEFLEQSQKLSPHSIRILLTGYTDIESVIQAINKGHVYRYVTKPWDTADLSLTVEQSIEKFDLESQLKITNEKLEKALSELKVLDEAKSRFMILINHELKTPLTTLMSFLELLEQENPSQEQIKYLSRIRKSTDRIHEIIQDSLELVTSELGSLKIQKEKVDLEKLIPEILKIFPTQKEHPNAAKYTSKTTSTNWIATHFQTDSSINKKNITTDAQLLHKVLTRLLKNALQHGLPTEPVCLTISNTSTHLQFEIKNAGKQIPGPVLEKILKPFGTHENIMNHSKGMGLGLTICQSLLKNLHSELQIESTASHFFVRFSVPL